MKQNYAKILIGASIMSLAVPAFAQDVIMRRPIPNINGANGSNQEGIPEPTPTPTTPTDPTDPETSNIVYVGFAQCDGSVYQEKCVGYDEQYQQSIPNGDQACRQQQKTENYNQLFALMDSEAKQTNGQFVVLPPEYIGFAQGMACSSVEYQPSETYGIACNSQASCEKISYGYNPNDITDFRINGVSQATQAECTRDYQYTDHGAAVIEGIADDFPVTAEGYAVCGDIPAAQDPDGLTFLIDGGRCIQDVYEDNGTTVVDYVYQADCRSVTSYQTDTGDFSVFSVPASDCENTQNSNEIKQIIQDVFEPDFHDPASVDRSCSAEATVKGPPRVEISETPWAYNSTAELEAWPESGVEQNIAYEKEYLILCHNYNGNLIPEIEKEQAILGSFILPWSYDSGTGGFNCMAEANRQIQQRLGGDFGKCVPQTDNKGNVSVDCRENEYIKFTPESNTVQRLYYERNKTHAQASGIVQRGPNYHPFNEALKSGSGGYTTQLQNSWPYLTISPLGPPVDTGPVG